MEGRERFVLVAGAGRSGTTWLGKLIDASPRVFYKSEPDNKRRLPWFRGVPSRIEPSEESPTLRERYARALDEATRHHAIDFVQRPDFPKDFLRNPLWRAFNTALRLRARLAAETTRPLRIPRLVYRAGAEPFELVVKSVTSNLRLQWLHRQFPELRIVFIVRHPGGYLSSWLRGVEMRGWRGFGERARLDSTVLPFPEPRHERWETAYLRGEPFERELVYWLVTNETPYAALRGSERFKVVVYEELCARPLEVIEEIYAFCGLSLHEQTRAFLRASTSSHDEGYHGIYKDPRYVAERWREELSARQHALLERHLEPSRVRELWR